MNPQLVEALRPVQDPELHRSIVDLGMHLGEGSGAAVALPVLRAAVATLAAMATFDAAGISTAPA